jgi:hypothetical protein
VSKELPIIDGFMYNPRLLYTPGRFEPVALEGLKAIRTGSYSLPVIRLSEQRASSATRYDVSTAIEASTGKLDGGVFV